MLSIFKRWSINTMKFLILYHINKKHVKHFLQKLRYPRICDSASMTKNSLILAKKPEHIKKYILNDENE